MVPSISELSAKQRRIVEASAEHLLVLAGPGSGKTLTIVERIGHLLAREVCSPEQILVMTFTIKAAEELRDRLAARDQAGVFAGTFHSICAWLLAEHGVAIGVKPPLRIADEPRQDAVIEHAAADVGCRLADRGDLSLADVKDHISRRKRASLEPGAWPADEPRRWCSDLLCALDEAYCRLLAEAGALDYDDLIRCGEQLLREDEPAATIVRRRFRFVFVDEFHDVSADQYRLLCAIAPPVQRRPHGTQGEGSSAAVMVVADPDQAIFSWRGADPDNLLSRFRRDYAPTVHRLSENFRSTRTIVQVANRFLKDAASTTVAGTAAPDGPKVYCCGYPDAEVEAEALAKHVRRALESGSYDDYDDIAVLFPLHARADIAETALIQHGIPVRRIRRGRFFDEPEVQETLRHLDLVAALSDPAFEPALNWPRVVVDELTMIHLRRLAREHGLRLTDLAERIDTFAGQVTPLTRVAIRQFVDTIAAELRPHAAGPIDALIARLLEALARRRPAFAAADRATVSGVLDFLGQPLAEAVTCLRSAIDAGRPVALVVESGLDAATAGVILAHALTAYLCHPVAICQGGDAPAGAFIIHLGGVKAAAADGFGLTERAVRQMRYSVTTQAWRIAQLLLASYETLHDGRFVVVDLETGSLHVNTTDIVELAAVRVDGRQIVGEPFHSLVRPRDQRSITFDATERHGLRWKDVRDAPGPEEVLPAFFSYVGGETLVGHNLHEFDIRILTRVVRSLGLPSLPNPTIDTCQLARRLFPGESHQLAQLASRFGLATEQHHRALPDARLTAGVFLRLLEQHHRDREVDLLTEALPLVAMSIRAIGAPEADEHALLIGAGARVLATGQGDVLIEQWRRMVTPRDADPAISWLGNHPPAGHEDDERWDRLVQGWQETVTRYLATSDDPTLAGFLHYAALAKAVDGERDGDGRVSMMTIHAAKGREWPLVFLLGMEEEVLPRWDAKSPERMAEERRLFYVGMTRAMRQLVLMWSASSLGRDRKPSRFITELPAELVEHRNHPAIERG